MDTITSDYVREGERERKRERERGRGREERGERGTPEEEGASVYNFLILHHSDVICYA